MKLITEVQDCSGFEVCVPNELFQQWADCVATIRDGENTSAIYRINEPGSPNATPALAQTERQIFVRLVDQKEMAELNGKWRNKQYPTNVLAFPAGEMPGVENYPLGDIVICVEVVQSEAGEQGKPFVDRMAHMFIHGLLHLAGFDHQLTEQASIMERIEEEALTRLGYAKPYEVS